jgi:hypothetical protein
MPERFKVSDGVESMAAALITEVMPLVESLPEGVMIVTPSEVDMAPKPFAVVTFRPGTHEATKAYNAGALRYVTMSFNKEDLRKRFEGNKK